jgi:hypothetical protein
LAASAPIERARLILPRLASVVQVAGATARFRGVEVMPVLSVAIGMLNGAPLAPTLG